MLDQTRLSSWNEIEYNRVTVYLKEKKSLYMKKELGIAADYSAEVFKSFSVE